MKNTNIKRFFNTKQITVTGMLSAITIVLGVTGLGFIPIPPFLLSHLYL
ncbi:hypothetical protein [Caldanaerobius polysaccharolyticus]|nr:hypothetical protein [Caldanaerobius polysaccharolyticus]